MYAKAVTHWKILGGLIVVVGVLATLTYSFVSPRGMFSGLHNDLKTIESAASPYVDLDGNTIDLETFKGKPLIVNSWASWIPFSQTELPMLIEVASQHRDALHVLAINRKEDLGVMRSFLDTFGISRSIIFLHDPSDAFYAAIGGYAMPETVFYDADGVMVQHKRGVLTREELDAFTNEILARK